MNFADIIKAYLEVGLLGLCAVMMIVIFYNSYKRSNKKDDSKDKLLSDNFNKLNNKMDTMVTTITNQNNKFMELQEKHYEEEKERNFQLVQAIINGVVNHVPSVEENKKLTSVNTEIDDILQDILLETGASRADVVQYHNGGKGVNHQAFLKMSVTNEKIQLGMKPIIGEFKDQFRSVLGYYVNEINDNGHCYIDNLDYIKEKDVGIYEFMLNRGIESKFGYGIKKDDITIAFIEVEFVHKEDVHKSKVLNSFKEHYRQIEKLLNM